MRGGCAILVRMLHTARLDHAQRQRLQRAENRRSAEYRPRRKAGDFFVRVLIGGADIDALHTDLAQDFTLIGAELRSLYSIGYYSSNKRHDNTFRKVVIETQTPGLVVRAKSGYFAK